MAVYTLLTDIDGAVGLAAQCDESINFSTHTPSQCHYELRQASQLQQTLDGFMSASLLLQSKVDFICFAQQKGEMENRLAQIIHYFPLVISPALIKWNYGIGRMAIAQTTFTTGIAKKAVLWLNHRNC